MTPNKKTKIYIYIGNGGYVPGVPTLNIPVDEWNALPKDLTDLALTNKLYQLVEVDPEPDKKPEKQEGE